MSRTQSLNSHVDMGSSSQELTGDYFKVLKLQFLWLAQMQSADMFGVHRQYRCLYVVTILNKFGPNFRGFFPMSSFQCPCI